MDPLHLEMVNEAPKGQANLTVIGLGGAGGNAVRRMIESGLIIFLWTDNSAVIYMVAQ